MNESNNDGEATARANDPIQMPALNFLSSLANSKSTMDMLSQAAMGSAVPPIPSAAATDTERKDRQLRFFCNQLPEPLQSYARTITNVTSKDEESMKTVAVTVARVDAYYVSPKTHLQSLTLAIIDTNTFDIQMHNKMPLQSKKPSKNYCGLDVE